MRRYCFTGCKCSGALCFYSSVPGASGVNKHMVAQQWLGSRLSLLCVCSLILVFIQFGSELPDLKGGQDAQSEGSILPTTVNQITVTNLGCQPMTSKSRTSAECFAERLRACPTPREMAPRMTPLQLDPDGSPILSMTGATCPYYFLAGSCVRTGMAVEFGTWLGGSLRCIGAGVAQTREANRVYGFDRFRAGQHGNFKKLRFPNGSRWAKQLRLEGENFNSQPLFEWYTKAVYHNTQGVRIGDLNQGKAHILASVGPGRIDLWTTDAAKDYNYVIKQLMIVKDRLSVGSLIILADFYVCNQEHGQVPYVYRELVGPGYFELLGVLEGNSHAIFGLRRKLPKLSDNKPDRGSCRSWDPVLQHAKDDASRLFAVSGETQMARSQALAIRLKCLDKTFRGFVCS